MTSSEAIPLLRDLIKQMPGLRHRPAYNAGYRAWEKEVVRVLAEGFDLSYLTRFERFKPHRVRDADSYDTYVADLDKKRRLLEEIVATHRSLICNAPPPEEGWGEEGALEVEVRLQPAPPGQSCSYPRPVAQPVAVAPAATRVAEPVAVAPSPRLVEPGPEAPRPQEIPAEPAPARMVKVAEPRAEAAAPKPPEPVPAPVVKTLEPKPKETMMVTEDKLRGRIAEKERLLAETQRALDDLRHQLDSLTRLKGLLLAEGQELRALVREALSGLGLEVASTEEGLFVRECGEMIPLEVETAPGKVPERALRRLIGRLADEPPACSRARGFLLGSAHLEVPIEERLAADLPYFEEGLKTQADSFGVCLLSLQDLFRAITCGESAEFKAKALSTTGLLQAA